MEEENNHSNDSEYHNDDDGASLEDTNENATAAVAADNDIEMEDASSEASSDFERDEQTSTSRVADDKGTIADSMSLDVLMKYNIPRNWRDGLPGFQDRLVRQNFFDNDDLWRDHFYEFRLRFLEPETQSRRNYATRMDLRRALYLLRRDGANHYLREDPSEPAEARDFWQTRCLYRIYIANKDLEGGLFYGTNASESARNLALTWQVLLEKKNEWNSFHPARVSCLGIVHREKKPASQRNATSGAQGKGNGIDQMVVTFIPDDDDLTVEAERFKKISQKTWNQVLLEITTEFSIEDMSRYKMHLNETWDGIRSRFRTPLTKVKGSEIVSTSTQMQRSHWTRIKALAKASPVPLTLTIHAIVEENTEEEKTDGSGPGPENDDNAANKVKADLECSDSEGGESELLEAEYSKASGN